MKYFSGPSRHRVRRRLLSAMSVVLGVVVGCATYDGIQTPPASDPTAQGGTDAADAGADGTPPDDSAGHNPGGAGGSGDSNVGGDGESDAGGGDADTADAGEGGSSGSGGRAGSDSGGRPGAGSGGRAGAGGSPSFAGSSGLPGAGSSGSGGTAGSSIVAGAGGSIVAGAGGASTDDQLLSQGKAVVADSTQAGNAAALGNDGSIVTRWCAANGDPNHYWQVDLGATRTLSRVDIAWEKAANYKFKVEGSTDGSTWAMLVDKTTTTSSASGQSYKLDSAPKARWVKITITGLPNSTSWASFYELQVFGH